MNTEQYERQKLDQFLELVSNEDETITSTGATLVNFMGTLYNVSGSTYDPKGVPKYKGKGWRKLLIAYGIPATSPCYVANLTPTGNSHPSFSVGGHMTTDSLGNVPVGGVCYLMPECHWHNNTARDGTLYYLNQHLMIQLTGYMLGELAATFQLRLPCSEAFGLLYKHDGWEHRNFATKADAEQFLAQLNGGKEVEHHLFERYLQGPGQSLKLVSVS